MYGVELCRVYREGVTFESFAGLPHHDILAAMELEHTAKPDSHVKFKTPNYLLTTTPADELQVVLNRAKAKAASVGSRRVLFYEDLLTDDDLIKRAGLSKAEIVALILYTGPMVSASVPLFFRGLLFARFFFSSG